MTTHPYPTPFEMAALVANAAESKKASNVNVLEVGKISSVSDYFVLCNGESPVQIKAIAEAIADTLEKFGQRPLGQERDRVGRWFLMDYGEVVVHIMHPQAREFYRLEDFWNHALPVERAQWLKEHRQAS